MVLIENQKIDIPEPKNIDIYIAAIGEKAKLETFDIIGKLRKHDIYCDYDITDKSLKSQMKYANKIRARYTMVLGDDEIKNGIAILKNMSTKETYKIKKDSSLFDGLLKAYLEIKNK